jgi:hypothetical protein
VESVFNFDSGLSSSESVELLESLSESDPPGPALRRFCNAAIAFEDADTDTDADICGTGGEDREEDGVCGEDRPLFAGVPAHRSPSNAAGVSRTSACSAAVVVTGVAADDDGG